MGCFSLFLDRDRGGSGKDGVATRKQNLLGRLKAKTELPSLHQPSLQPLSALCSTK
jgi:hypothetical protein